MPDHIEHEKGSAYYDEEWCVHCRCGAAFWARYRQDAEAAVEKHVVAEGLASARAPLNREERDGS